MKSSLFSALVVAAAVALGSPLQPRSDEPDSIKTESLEPKRFKELGSKRVKITYRSMLVPGIDDEETHGMKEFRTINSAKPCGDCLITEFQAGLEFKDGTTANADKGLWLHHTAFLNMNRTDPACVDRPDVPFASGNERIPFDMTAGGTFNAGYYLKQTDLLASLTEVMNESQDPREVFLTVEWEFVPGAPASFQISQPMWLDVSGLCFNDSQVAIPKDTKTFNFTMAGTWTPTFNAEISSIWNHLHDGGIHQQVTKDGKPICDSKAGYGESAGFITHVGEYGREHQPKKAPEPEHEHEHEHSEPAAPHDHGTDAHILHISSMTPCTKLGKIGPGNQFTVTSFYDMTNHDTSMTGHHEEAELVMGIAVMHLARPMEEGMKDILNSKNPDLDFSQGRGFRK